MYLHCICIGLITTVILATQACAIPQVVESVTYQCRTASRITCSKSICTKEETGPIHAEFSYSTADKIMQACLHTDCYSGTTSFKHTASDLFRFAVNGAVQSQRPVNGSPPPGMPPFPLTMAVDMGKAAFTAVWGVEAEAVVMDSGSCQQTIRIRPNQPAGSLSPATRTVLNQIAALVKASSRLRLELHHRPASRQTAQAVDAYLTKQGVSEQNLQLAVSDTTESGRLLELRLIAVEVK